MASDRLSQKIFDLSKYVEDLKGMNVSEPGKAAEILSNAINELQVRLTELSGAKDELFQDLSERESDNTIMEWKRFRTLARAAFECIVLTKNGRIIDANEQFAKAHGYELSEVIGKSITDFLIPEDRERVIQSIECGQERIGEYHALRKDGSVFLIEAHGYLIEGDDGPVRVGVLRDITERKKAEDALKESERKFKAIADTSQAAITLYQDGHVIYANEASETIFGYSLDERSRMELKDLLHPDYREKAEERMKALLKGEAHLSQNEYKIIRKDGEERCVLSSGSKITYDGKPAVLITSMDITEWKKVENALMESEEKFRALADATPNIIFVYRDNRLLYVNPAAVSASEYSEEELLTLNFIDIIHPDYHHVLKEGIKARMEGHRGLRHYELKAIKKTGEERWLDVSANFISYGGSPAGIATCMDITERKRAEEALRESEDRYRGIVETAEEGIATHEPDGTISYVNQHMADMLGYSREEIIGRSSLDFVDDEEKDAVNQAHKSLKERGSFNKERKLRRKDGSILWTLANVSPRRDNTGNFIGYLAMHTDITERKNAEEKLRKSEENYRHLVESSGSIILRTDMDLRITFINQYGLQFFGYTPEEVIGKEAIGTIIPQKDEKGHDLASMAEDLVLHPDKYPTNVNQNMCKDGRLVWVSWANKPIYDNQGNLKEVLCIGNDLTRLKEAEAAIEENERRFRDAIDHFPNVFVIYDADRRIRKINSKGLAILGLSEKDIIGKKDEEIFPPQMINSYLPALKRAIETKKPQTLERKRDPSLGGQAIAISIIPLLNEKRDIRQILAISHDISEHKRIEDELEQRVLERTAELTNANLALKESEDRFRVALKNSPILVFSQDRDLRYTWAYNPHPAFSVDTILGKTDEELFLPEDAAKLTKIKRRVLESSIGERAEIQTTVNGEELFHDLTVEPLRNAAGEIEGLTCAATNITDLKKAKEAAEAAAKVKAAFMANMSHELRTPMNYIVGATSLLLDEPLSSDLKDCIETIKKGSDEMMALINNILSFSEVEKKKLTLDYQPLDLKALIDNSLKLVASQAIKKGLNITSSITYGTPDNILGDYGKLTQVLSHILSNAIKFTDEGDISLSLSSKHIGGNKHQFLFTVKDMGIGIPTEKMNELFQPFSQVETTISRKRDGAGIGLAICKGLVELMGGKIWAKSETGKGSTFYFTIEAEIAPNKGARSAVKSEGTINTIPKMPAEQHSLRILVVEDDSSNQDVTIKMLKRLGYNNADAVADGLEVLQALEMRPYDVILMDVKMPNMDGITTTKEIRRIWPNNGPKIIALTAYALAGDKERCLEAGMDDYIAKPMRVGELVEALKRCALGASGER